MEHYQTKGQNRNSLFKLLSYYMMGPTETNESLCVSNCSQG